MSDHEQEEAPTKKEAAVLSEVSLKALAQELGSMGLKIAMYLNIPTTRLVHIGLAAGEKDQADEDSNLAMLEYWKAIRSGSKDKDKVNDLERALREAGMQDTADTVIDRHRDNMELSEDCFPAA